MSGEGSRAFREARTKLEFAIQGLKGSLSYLSDKEKISVLTSITAQGVCNKMLDAVRGSEAIADDIIEAGKSDP